MKNIRFTITFLSLFIFFPLTIMAGDELTFSDFKMNDGTICSMPLEKGKLKVTFQDETVKYNKQLKAMILPKGTVITISAPKGEIISGLSLRPSGKSSDMKDYLSCETGKFQHGFWNGSAKSVSFRCLKDCDLSKIRASFKTDAPEAYVKKIHLESLVEFDEEASVFFYVNNGFFLVFCYDEQKELWDSSSIEYSINDNLEYPQWYEDNQDIIGFKFDDSFINYHPKRTSHWFDGKECDIYGLWNLNTSETFDMSYMFANFSHVPLKNLGDVKSLSSIFTDLDFSNVRDMNHMFYKCNISHYEISSLHINPTMT